jgi:hypothetical protein
MKVQAIRSRKQSPRFYVNLPLPLAAALELEAGETVRWQLVSRRELRLWRVTGAARRPPRQTTPSEVGGFSAESTFNI